jgi:hypothetical protein
MGVYMSTMLPMKTHLLRQNGYVIRRLQLKSEVAISRSHTNKLLDYVQIDDFCQSMNGLTMVVARKVQDEVKSRRERAKDASVSAAKPGDALQEASCSRAGIQQPSSGSVARIPICLPAPFDFRIRTPYTPWTATSMSARPPEACLTTFAYSLGWQTASARRSGYFQLTVAMLDSVWRERLLAKFLLNLFAARSCVCALYPAVSGSHGAATLSYTYLGVLSAHGSLPTFSARRHTLDSSHRR